MTSAINASLRMIKVFYKLHKIWFTTTNAEECGGTNFLFLRKWFGNEYGLKVVMQIHGKIIFANIIKYRNL